MFHRTFAASPSPALGKNAGRLFSGFFIIYNGGCEEQAEFAGNSPSFRKEVS